MINSERDRPTQPAKNNSLSAQLFLWHGRGTLTNIKTPTRVRNRAPELTAGLSELRP